MRLWVGEEREGREKGVETLFVESVALYEHDLYLIKDVAKERSISRIYLGAGKVDLQSICDEWENVLSGFSVVVECSWLYAASKPSRLVRLINKGAKVVVRKETTLPSDLLERCDIKIENATSLYVYTEKEKTNLSDLYDALYSNDKLINI